MNTFNFYFLCLQACLVQSVWGQYNNFGQSFGAAANTNKLGYRNPSASLAGTGISGARYPNNIAPGVASAGPLAATPPAMYGGVGDGDVSVNGELPVVGNTVINGHVPMVGAVKFNGDVPAGGVVTITGTYTYGSNTPLVYQ